MANVKVSKSRANSRNNKRRKVAFKPNPNPNDQKLKKPLNSKPKSKPAAADEDPILFGSDSEPDIPSSPTRIQSLIEPYTKPQLIAFLLDAAASDPDLRSRIRSLADSDTSHRKIFVHGLGWDATKGTLMEVFSSFGAIEDCHVVVDKATGKAKGYAFVLFKDRAATAKALKEPQKRIGNRMVSCQLASVGGVKADYGRKVYVGNVPLDARVDRLKEFFARYGEIEAGPIGFDMMTGRSKGYAMFVYKTTEEAKRVLEEPYKMFDGHQLHCKLANTDAQKAAAVPQVQQPIVPPVATAVAPMPAALPSVAVPAQQQQQQQQQQLLAAAMAAQNLAFLAQNPAYAALLAQNPLLAAAFNPGLVNATALGLGGLQYGGTPSALGAYSTGQGTAAAGLTSTGGLQGLQGYQAGSSLQTGQLPSGTTGGFTSPFVW